MNEAFRTTDFFQPIRAAQLDFDSKIILVSMSGMFGQGWGRLTLTLTVNPVQQLAGFAVEEDQHSQAKITEFTDLVYAMDYFNQTLKRMKQK